MYFEFFDIFYYKYSCIFENTVLLKCLQNFCSSSCTGMFATMYHFNNIHQTLWTDVLFCTATKNVTIPRMAIYNSVLYSNIEESHMTSCHMSLSIQSCRMWIAAFWRIVRVLHSTVKQKMPAFQHWFICLRAKYYCRVLWECSSSLACSADSGCFSWIRLSGLIRKDMRPVQPYGSETSNALLMKTNQEKGSETFI